MCLCVSSNSGRARVFPIGSPQMSWVVISDEWAIVYSTFKHGGTMYRRIPPFGLGISVIPFAFRKWAFLIDQCLNLEHWAFLFHLQLSSSNECINKVKKIPGCVHIILMVLFVLDFVFHIYSLYSVVCLPSMRINYKFL